MNRKGSFFLAFFTVVAVFVFIVFVNMNKEKILNETKIVNVGKFSEVSINATLDEEEIELFLYTSMEYASFNALLKLGNDGGTLKEQNCEGISEHVIWKDNCFFSDNLEENFFDRFKDLFDGYVKEYRLDEVNIEWKIDEDGNLVVEPDGLIELGYENVRYGFEPDSEYALDYDFSDYNKILSKANDCIKDEEDKGVTRNNLFENCRNDKDFRWTIKIDGRYVVFDVAKMYKNLGEVAVKFALPYNQ